MKISVGFERMYAQIFGSPDETLLRELTTSFFYRFSQTNAKTAEDVLIQLMFKVPADVIAKYNVDPEEARKMLERAIAGTRAWEDVGMIDDASFTLEDWEVFLNKTGLKKFLENPPSNKVESR